MNRSTQLACITWLCIVIFGTYCCIGWGKSTILCWYTSEIKYCSSWKIEYFIKQARLNSVNVVASLCVPDFVEF